MKSLRFGSNLVAVLVLALAFSSLASAQATRTWVSGVGDDANPCSRTAPCKTFAGAISKTAAGGEIDNLDAGGFGAVTITKSITIDGSEGGIGSVLVAGTNGITIAAGANDVVTIRNVEFQGLDNAGTSSGLNGISITSAGIVHLEHVKITGFSQNGVNVAGSAAVNLTMYDCTITDIAAAGVNVTTTAGIAHADLNNVRVYNANAGVQGGVNSAIVVSDSDLSFNSYGALASVAGAGINLINCQVNNNTTAGVQSITASTIRVMSCTFQKDATALNPNGGNLYSDGLNNANGNTSNGTSTGATTKI
jgi:hypothetical protein